MPSLYAHYQRQSDPLRPLPQREESMTRPSPRIKRILARVQPAYAARLTCAVSAFYAGDSPELAAARYRVPVGKVLGEIRRGMG